MNPGATCLLLESELAIRPRAHGRAGVEDRQAGLWTLFFRRGASGNPPDPNDQIVRAGQTIDFAYSATTQKPLVRRSPALAGRSRIEHCVLTVHSSY
ncbi:hypothetical protein HYZ99_00330 [Candidatus Peregrinibacteria bacterium]|nr:hypothetical protein [Candidatus Peregrinibacteria bacterium]